MHCSVYTGERYSAVDNSNDGSDSDRRNVVQLGRLLLNLNDLKLHHHRNQLHDYDNDNDNNNHQRGLALSYDDNEDDDDVQAIRGQNRGDVSSARMSKRGPGTCINSCMTGGMSFIRCKSMCN